MALDFPSSPTVGQTYSVGDRTWKWNGSGWYLLSSAETLANAAIAMYLYATCI